MRPSFSPRRVTVDSETGRRRFDDTLTEDDDDNQPNFTSNASSTNTPLTRTMLLQGALQAVLSGIIIAIVLCPCMIGFTTIIYSHPDFEQVMPKLIKLVFVSSVMHQLVISYLSSLPFAIGQVQDAGLIFLSSMATSIMDDLGPSIPLEERVATVVVHLSICTVFVGLGLILTGKARLASLVQYLPTPVIGGYLAYIGFFMIKAGLSLMTGANLKGLASWIQMLGSRNLALIAPGLIAGILLSLITTRFLHFAVFPSCLVALPVLFYIILFLSGSSMNDARQFGFLATEGPSISVVDVYGVFDFAHIHWSVMFPSQLPTLFSMFVMIAFASSLDIASICMGTRSTLDYNRELQTVGTSNLVSGLTGGYTGSYIFSQTIFGCRFHPKAVEERLPGFSKIIGLSLVACELGIGLAPISITTVIPKFLFGSVMIFIGIELLKTWLVGVFTKLLFPEYLTVVGTFCFLNLFGVQLGLACGIALAALCFLVEYSKAQVVRVVKKSSNVIRNAEQHELLYSQRNAGYDPVMKQQPIVTIELHGHIFFGSATRIQNCVKRAVFILQPCEDRKNRKRDGFRFRKHLIVSGRDQEQLPLLSHSAQRGHYDTSPSRNSIQSTMELVNLDGDVCTDPERGPTQFVVLDFSQVTGLDATAARSCFLALKLLFRQQHITVVYCGMRDDVDFLLRANDVIPPLSDHQYHNKECYVTSDLDLALDWCEQQLILSAARQRSIKSGMKLAHSPLGTQTLPLPQIFFAYLPEGKQSEISGSNALEELATYFYVRDWTEYERIFSIDDDSDAWYVLLQGQVTLYTSGPSSSLDTPGAIRDRSVSTSTTNTTSTGVSEQSSSDVWRELVGRVRAGCIFGDLDFMLNQKRVIDATATAPSTMTAAITRAQMEELVATRLDLAFLLQEIVLRASYMTLAEKLHSIVI